VGANGEPQDPRAASWLEAGASFEWRPARGTEGSVRIFHAEFGSHDAPVLLLLHGFPTSSLDWSDVVGRLGATHRVCTLDFPGYGFSDKPEDWPYSLFLDAELVAHYLTTVVGERRCTVLSHDRGDSVALLLHHMARSGELGVELDELLLTNGNIFLPLANLTTFQKLVLDPASAESVLEQVTPEALAEGMGRTTFSPPRDASDPTISALAATFSWNSGVKVLHRTIQYLRERAEHERSWLESLAGSPVPTTVLWGALDTVSPPRVAFHVWEHYLRDKPGLNELWLLPGANHYLQNDRPDAFVDAVTAAFARTGTEAPGPLSEDDRSPIRVDQSAGQLRAAGDAFVL
jgi:pimeloyl-ACP methyl ester carboxylesterase